MPIRKYLIGTLMKPEDFVTPTSGQVIRSPKGYWAFIPAPLPPELKWSSNIVTISGEAERALAELASIGRNFPEPHIMVHSFIAQEAVMSSRIEGTQASLADVYQYEANKSAFIESNSDTREVHNYVTALEYGLTRLDKFPISLRFIRELHEKLMQNTRGEIWTPGEFRRTQNWIGPAGSTLETAPFVPPPVDEMLESLNQFELFIHAPSDLPPLIRLGLIHYQFEAIHPFLDGNGRVGRLLMILLLRQWNLIQQPLLYLSGFFEKHRREYYERLLAVSRHGEWTEWIIFFLTGIREQANEATRRIQVLESLRDKYYQIVFNQRDNIKLRNLIDFLIGHPILTIRQVQKSMKISDYKTTQRYIIKLLEMGILRETTGKSRNRVFRADEILKTMEKRII